MKTRNWPSLDDPDEESGGIDLGGTRVLEKTHPPLRYWVPQYGLPTLAEKFLYSYGLAWGNYWLLLLVSAPRIVLL